MDIHYTIGENCSVAPTAVIEDGCVIGSNVVLHHNVVLYAGTRVGDNTEIFDNTVIGRPPKSAGNLVHKLADLYAPVLIGSNCVIGSCVTIYAGCVFENNILIGDGARVREGAVVGDYAVIAMNCTFNHNVTFGSGSKIMDLSHVTPNTVVAENVFVGAGVITVNDNAMRIKGSEVGRSASIFIGTGARVGSGSLILPNQKIGSGALVGACSLVSHDVPEGETVLGIPARPRKKGTAE